MTLKQVIEELNTIADPKVAKKKRVSFGVHKEDMLGILHRDLMNLVKVIGKNDELALQLIDSGIYEARLLASKIFNPRNLTKKQMEQWICFFDTWEICDSFCMGVFAKSPHAVEKIFEWSTRDAEYEKRAAFATLSSYCMADKKSDNELFESFFPLIIEASGDDRNFVKKAVNWALRTIGKRNVDLNKKAIEVSKKLLESPYPSAHWIAKDAIRELSGNKVNILDYPREIYRSV